MKHKNLIILVAGVLLLVGVVAALRLTPQGTSIIWNISNQGTWLLPLVAVSALIDSINPCAFSILLLTIAFLLSLGKMRSSILRIGGAYILGIFIVYIMIGLGILETLHIFNTPHFMAKVGALLLLVFGGINIINYFVPEFPIKLRIPQKSHRAMASLMEKGSIPTAFLLGVLVGLCEFPCTGGPYLMVLGLLHDQATYLKGVSYLLMYNVIFVLPLVIILFISSNSVLLEKVQTWKKENTRAMRLWGGIITILLGIIIFFL